MTRVVLIANPGTPRCEAFVRAAVAFGVTPVVVPWADVIPARGSLDHLPQCDEPAVVRLESPGKDGAVTRLLLAAGDPRTDWQSVPLPKGLLLRPGLQFQGFVRVLQGLRQAFDARPHLRPTACPLAVARMFDKNATLDLLFAAGVPVPEWIDGDNIPPPRRRLPERVRHFCWEPSYFKLNSGASGTGIVVLQTNSGSSQRGVTTLHRRGDDFFNNRMLRAVENEELMQAVWFLIREGVNVQRGVPHAQFDGQNADLRVVCVGGKVVATIFRLSPHPITNLHLGGRRGDWRRCRDAIPTRHWLDALDSATAAAGCFDSLVAGVDVIFEPGFRRHYVLEVNAFGDFFPGWTDAAGRSLHEIELRATVGEGVRPRLDPLLDGGD